MNLKSMLPFEKYTLRTSLSKEEVLKKIADNIQQEERFKISVFGKNFSKPYSGKIIDNTFSITRNINYRNSFLPFITGTVVTSINNKTNINIKMRPILPVLIFISIWMSLVGVACISILTVAIINLDKFSINEFSPAALIPFGMFLFGFLLTYFAFKFESKKSKEFLERLLKAEIKNEF
jgi:hypothetical protein